MAQDPTRRRLGIRDRAVQVDPAGVPVGNLDLVDLVDLDLVDLDLVDLDLVDLDLVGLDLVGLDLADLVDLDLVQVMDHAPPVLSRILWG
jgi:hypothetical protein